jgi:hypothetical protein
MRKTALAIIGAASLGFASSAAATITITTDQQDEQGDNILFGPTIGATEGMTVLGETQDGFGITFTSTQALIADGGQATVSAQTGDLTNLMISPTDAAGFEFIEFNLSNAGNGGTATGVTITGTDQNGQEFSQFFASLTGGANMFLAVSDESQYITNLTITATGGGFSQVAQVRVGDAVAAVPEPATWGMMLLGFGAAGYSMRRRRRQNSGIAQLA